jgi:hypothetical protein
MANSFTLDDIRSAAEAKYGSLDIDVDGTTVSLVNPLRLPGKRREQLKKFQDAFNADDREEDEETLLGEILRTVILREAHATKLIDALEGDLASMMEVFERYGKVTELGEASASAS